MLTGVLSGVGGVTASASGTARPRSTLTGIEYLLPAPRRCAALDQRWPDERAGGVIRSVGRSARS